MFVCIAILQKYKYNINMYVLLFQRFCFMYVRTKKKTAAKRDDRSGELLVSINKILCSQYIFLNCLSLKHIISV